MEEIKDALQKVLSMCSIKICIIEFIKFIEKPLQTCACKARPKTMEDIRVKVWKGYKLWMNNRKSNNTSFF